MVGSRHSQQGFTLLEVMVSVGLFAIIAVAGFYLVDSILRTQSRTEGRLDRLAEMQRTMTLLRLDFEQATGKTFRQDGTTVSAERFSDTSPDGVVMIAYGLTGNNLVRQIDNRMGGMQVQTLIHGVEAVEWEFYVSGTGWRQQWPPPNRNVFDPSTTLPEAVALTITLDGVSGEAGTLRRIIEMPTGRSE